MVSEQIILGADIFSLLFLLLTIVFLVKNRDFERSEFENSINVLIFGLFFLLLNILTSIIKFADLAFHSTLAKAIPDITTYVTYMITVADVALLPLFAVCMLVGVFLARENF